MKAFDLEADIKIDIANATASLDTLISKARQLNGELNSTPSVNGLGGGATGNSGTGGTTGTGGTSEKSSFLNNVFSVSIGSLSSQAVHALAETIKSAVQVGYQYNLDKETYIASLKSMMGVSWEEAESFFSRLTSLSVSTPLNMNSIGEAATRFLALGYDPDEILEKMLVLGNVARGDNDTFVRIAKAFTDVYGKLGLKSQEKNQFAEAGVPILGLLADLYGVPYETQAQKDAFNEQMLSTMEQGGIISPDDVWNALKKATEEGGLFYMAMSNAMQTTKGHKERADESYKVFMGTLLEKGGVMDFMKNLYFSSSNLFQTATDVLEGNDTNTQTPKELLRNIYELFAGSFTEDEWSEELLARAIDRGLITEKDFSKFSFAFTPEEMQQYAATGDMFSLLAPYATKVLEDLNFEDGSIFDEFSEAVDLIPGKVAEGFKGAKVQVTVGTGNIVLDSGTLVGTLTPKVNVALGGMLGNA